MVMISQSKTVQSSCFNKAANNYFDYTEAPYVELRENNCK